MNRTAFLLAALGVSLVLALLLSPFASSSPDGLERVAEDKGFMETAEGAELWEAAPAPDYLMPGVSHEGLATGLAGAAGTLIMFGAGMGLARVLARRRSDAEELP